MVKVDARLIAATNRDLSKEVHQGRFREDLFYRLNVIEIAVPPLRERIEDIPILIKQIMSTLASELHVQKIHGLDHKVLSRLLEYSWPGNVRELRNLLERAIILSLGGKIEYKHFGLPGREEESPSEEPLPGSSKNYNEVIRETKLRLITEALKKAGGKRYEAARLLGLTRDALKRQMTTLGLLGAGESESINR
jgi:DNA-binding NtrC family response regulator